MLILVIALNVLIALGCLFVAWQLWQIRRTLSQVADALLIYERNTHDVLYGAPEAILQGQTGTHQLRQQYQTLAPQLQKFQQLLSLLGLGLSLWQRRPLPLRRPTSRKRGFRRSRI